MRRGKSAVCTVAGLRERRELEEWPPAPIYQGKSTAR
jgi:hypothetical protein